MSNPQFCPIDSAQVANISEIWDELAPMRYDDIASGRDRSYTETLLPIIEEFCHETSGENLIDAGCGVGFASKMASQYFSMVDAIDLSENSISIALQRNFAANLSYIKASVEEFAVTSCKYDALISSMVLMDCTNHKSYLRACFGLITTGGKMIFTLCHPSFWPRYWGFEKYSWFNYNSEFAFEANFRTSSTGVSPVKTIYFHRPLSSYLNELSKLGARDIRVREISGISSKNKLLDKYPRYLVVEAKK